MRMQILQRREVSWRNGCGFPRIRVKLLAPINQSSSFRIIVEVKTNKQTYKHALPLATRNPSPFAILKSKASRRLHSIQNI